MSCILNISLLSLYMCAHCCRCSAPGYFCVKRDFNDIERYEDVSCSTCPQACVYLLPLFRWFLLPPPPTHVLFVYICVDIVVVGMFVQSVMGTCRPMGWPLGQQCDNTLRADVTEQRPILGVRSMRLCVCCMRFMHDMLVFFCFRLTFLCIYTYACVLMCVCVC
jgi:hypothetical protein